MIDREEFQAEGTLSEHAAGFDLDQGRGDPIFGELRSQEGQRQLRADDRNVRSLPQQIRHGADVVFVTVGEHDCHDVAEAITQVTPIGKYHVHTGLMLLGEENTTVDDQNLAVTLENGHVAADFPESAQRYHA